MIDRYRRPDRPAIARPRMLPAHSAGIRCWPSSRSAGRCNRAPIIAEMLATVAPRIGETMSAWACDIQTYVPERDLLDLRGLLVLRQAFRTRIAPGSDARSRFATVPTCARSSRASRSSSRASTTPSCLPPVANSSRSGTTRRPSTCRCASAIESSASSACRSLASCATTPPPSATCCAGSASWPPSACSQRRRSGVSRSAAATSTPCSASAAPSLRRRLRPRRARRDRRRRGNRLAAERAIVYAARRRGRHAHPAVDLPARLRSRVRLGRRARAVRGRAQRPEHPHQRETAARAHGRPGSRREDTRNARAMARKDVPQRADHDAR